MIQVEGIVKHYGTIRAVAGVSFQVAPGEVYALLGANGAGKTTTLRAIAGLVAPDAGSVRIDGRDIATDPVGARRALGFLPSAAGVYERLSAREALEFAGRLHGVPDHRLDQRIRELADIFALGAFMAQHCGTLSTGQRRRVALARAVVHSPPAIVLDEPTLGLDLVASEAVYSFVSASRASGAAVLLSTHRMEEVRLLADRVGILAGGRLAADGPPGRIVEELGTTDLTEAFLEISGVRR